MSRLSLIQPVGHMGGIPDSGDPLVWQWLSYLAERGITQMKWTP